MIIRYQGLNIGIPSTIYTISLVTGDIVLWDVRHIFGSIDEGDFGLEKGFQ